MKGSAEFVKNLKFDDLDERTIQKAKNCLLDLIGAVLGGAKTKAAEISLQFAKDLGILEQATVWATRDKLPFRSVAFVHGTMASALDIDDGHRMAVGHPGGVVIPAAFSIAEYNKNTGKDLLEAIVCGYEVGIRVGHVLRTKISRSTSLGSGRWGSVGAAAAVAKLLRLNVEEIKQALAISATFSPVSPVTDDLRTNGVIPMSKFCSGWGAEVGICSALLAKRGFTGVSSAIDFSSSLLPNYGKSFEINNVYFKPFTACRWTHPAIEATFQLLNEHRELKKESIAKITVGTFLEATHLNQPHPQTMESAQYSIPFLIGAAVIDGKIGLEQITQNRLSDPNILAVADKVKVLHKPEIDKDFPKLAPAEIEIETFSGKSYTTRVDIPKGDPTNPMNDEELTDKFKNLATRSISMASSERVIEVICQIEKLSSITELIDVFYL